MLIVKKQEKFFKGKIQLKLSKPQWKMTQLRFFFYSRSLIDDLNCLSFTQARLCWQPNYAGCFQLFYLKRFQLLLLGSVPKFLFLFLNRFVGPNYCVSMAMLFNFGFTLFKIFEGSFPSTSIHAINYFYLTSCVNISPRKINTVNMTSKTHPIILLSRLSLLTRY